MHRRMASVGARGNRIGFVWRIEMVRPLTERLPRAELPAGYAFAPFQRALLPALAQVEHLAFRGSPDARAFPDQLASPRESLAFWQRAVEHGRVDPKASLVLVHEARPCGFVQGFAAHGVGYLSSLAVLPEHRGGTGRALVVEALRRFQLAGLRFGALTVTAENARALSLYERLGFHEVGWSIATYLEG